jgi:hypothetical protein
MAQVRVVLSGLTNQAGVVDVILTPAVYDFVASGIADADSADITLTVRDRQAAEVTSVEFSLTLVEANASPGDTGSGANEGVLIVEGVQSVPIEFYWQGSTPAADVGVDMEFYDSPDIISWSSDPPSPVRPATRVDVEVEATNNEGPQVELTVDSQFVDADDSVINSTALALDLDGMFKGTIEAPTDPGHYSLRIVATDLAEGATQHARPYTVR